MRVFVGIDPGFTGAVGVIKEAGAWWRADVWDLPIIGEGAGKRVDGPQLLLDLEEWRTDGDGGLWHVFAALEKAQSMPKQGIASTCRYCAVYGALQVVLDLLSARTEYVAPGTWKRAMGLTGQGKDASREMAMRLFPDLRDFFSRKKDDGRAEAILLADWLRRTENERSTHASLSGSGGTG